MYSFPNFEPVFYFMSGSNCCFLTYIQVSQEAGIAELIEKHFNFHSKECLASQFILLLPLKQLRPSIATMACKNSTMQTKNTLLRENKGIKMYDMYMDYRTWYYKHQIFS